MDVLTVHVLYLMKKEQGALTAINQSCIKSQIFEFMMPLRSDSTLHAWLTFTGTFSDADRLPPAYSLNHLKQLITPHVHTRCWRTDWRQMMGLWSRCQAQHATRQPPNVLALVLIRAKILIAASDSLFQREKEKKKKRKKKTASHLMYVMRCWNCSSLYQTTALTCGEDRKLITEHL